MYLRATRDGRPDVLARLAAVPPPAMPPGASSDLLLDRPGAVPDDDVATDRFAAAESSWSWDAPGEVGLPGGGPALPRWIDDVPARSPLDDDLTRRPRRRDRVLTAPPAAIALVVIGVLACVVTIVTVVSGASDDVPTSVAFPAAAGPVSPASTTASARSGSATATGSPTAPPPPADLVVSVVGLVRSPGLVRVPPTARIADAIARAGGGRPGADLLGLNMAQQLHDGDQVLVGYADPAGGPALRSAVVSGAGAGGPTSGSTGPARSSAGAPPAASGGGGRVDLNSADEAALDTLPGVGPKTAAAILEWRQRNGRFTSVDQLAEVDGIGPARLATLRELVTVG
ncbi:ComEA family DNA-binding protein [Williamsia sp. SKLECPSW1]